MISEEFQELFWRLIGFLRFPEDLGGVTEARQGIPKCLRVISGSFKRLLVLSRWFGGCFMISHGSSKGSQGHQGVWELCELSDALQGVSGAV